MKEERDVEVRGEAGFLDGFSRLNADSEFMEAFARRLFGRMQASGLTLDQVARLAALTVSDVSDCLRGTAAHAPTIVTVSRVARALNISVASLFGEDPPT